jgi:hypothetical protein
VSADFEELLSALEQKVSPAHISLLAVDVQNDFAADLSYGPLTLLSMCDKITGIRRTAKGDCSLRVGVP